MRIRTTFFTTILAVLLAAGMANAALIDLGNGVVKDTVTGYNWYQDLSAFAGQDYVTQVAGVAGLNTMNGGAGFAGITNWQVATDAQYLTLSSVLTGASGIYTPAEVTGAFLPSHANYSYFGLTGDIWVGRVSDLDYYGHVQRGFQDWTTGVPVEYTNVAYVAAKDTANPYIGVWVVATPIPGAIWLLGTGLLGLIGLRRTFKG